MESSRRKRPRTGLELLLDTSSAATPPFHVSTDLDLIRPLAHRALALNTAGIPPGAAYQQTDEDRRFFELAQEALEATGRTVDPTIQDLLQRLQYALLPHGNPIRDGQSLRTLLQGHLDVHGFYDRFPNLSNDIFVHQPDLWAQDRGQHLGNDQRRNLAAQIRGRTLSTFDQMGLGAHGEPFASQGHDNGGGNVFDIHVGPTAVNPRNSRDSLLKLSRRHTHPTVSTALERDMEYSDDEEHASEERNFACANCPMTFRRLLDLKRHEKQHLPVLPNVCDLCGKGFARKDALKRHRGTLTCQRNALARGFGD